VSDRTPIRVCYADPPYPGCAHLYSKVGTREYHPDAGRWDDIDEHVALLARLDREFPDGWAFSTTTTALAALLPRAPAGTRLGAWVKTFISSMVAKTNGPQRAWEPVLFKASAARYENRRIRAFDWVAAPCGAGHTEAFIGAKPPAFSSWLFDLLAVGEHPDDVFVDMFPGSGAVTRAWEDFRGRPVTRGAVVQGALFGES
jgi:hypothetical protein